MPDNSVLVTGAGGFIGSHLVEALVARGHKVRALVRYSGRADVGNLELIPRETLRAVELVRGDVTDPTFVRGIVKDCETVYHLAALISIPYSYGAARNVFDVNVMGTLHVAQACVATGARMVHTSTSEVYGSAQTVPITERHPLVAQSPYAASKTGADQLVESFHRSYGLRSVTVRPFNTYGPRQSARAVIPSIIVQAIDRGVAHIGSLHTTRDMNFVEDTVRGFVAAGNAPDKALGQTVNLATGTEVSIGQLAEKIFGLVGKPLALEADAQRVRPAASEVERLVGDASRARSLIGWESSVPLSEGLARTIEYVRANIHRFRPEEYLL